MTPADLIAQRERDLAVLLTRPPCVADCEEYGHGKTCEHHDAPLRYEPEDDDHMCIECATEILASMRDAFTSTPPATIPLCLTCHTPEGALDTAYLAANGSCVFGCGTLIDSGETGMCGNCRDHSANFCECETCSQAYEDWQGGTWEAVKA